MSDTMTVDEFRRVTLNGGVTMRGFIKLDGNQPGGILFGFNPLICPTRFIPDSKTLSITKLGTSFCRTSGGDAALVTYAEVQFQQATGDDGKLFEGLILDLVQAAQMNAAAAQQSASGSESNGAQQSGSSCGCDASGNSNPGLFGRACGCTNGCIGACTFGNRCTGICF